jgi:hypothetical protein
MFLLLCSIELSEWYQPENEIYFVYFDSWDDLKQKIIEYSSNIELFINKRISIIKSIRASNTISLDKWRNIIFSQYNICR